MAEDNEDKKDTGWFKSYPKETDASGKPKDESGWQFKPKLVEFEMKDNGKTVKDYGYKKTDREAKEREDVEKGAAEKKGSGFSIKSSTGSLYQGPKDKGAIWTSKKTAEDKSFVSFVHYEYDVKGAEAAYDWEEKKASLTVVKVSGKVSVVHGELDFVNAFTKLLGLTPEKPEAGAPGSDACGGGGGPFAARMGDPTTHGTPLSPGTGSPDVLIGGMPAWRAVIDFHACPVVKGTVPDVGGQVLKGAPTVLINFMFATRAGDMIVEVPGGPNSILKGCPTVMIGDGGSGGGGGGGEKPAVKVELKAQGDLFTASGDVNVGANVDLKKGEGEVVAKASAMAAVAQGEVKGALKFRIPFTDHYVVLGGTASGSAVSIGAEAGARASINKVDPSTGNKTLCHVEVGAKVAFGLGLGLKFGIDIE